MMRITHWIALSLLAQFAPLLLGQATAQTDAENPQVDAQYRQIDERLKNLTSALEQTRGELAAAVDEIHRLRIELEQTRAAKAPEVPAETVAAKLTEEIARIREDQSVIQEQVKVHEQIKVETLSRYHLWFSGLVLFNAFANRGTVDVSDLPNIALPNYNPTGNNVAGATVRQTIVGLTASGPRLFGAQSTADLNLDFSSNGNAEAYPAPSGSTRIHSAHIRLEWPHDRIEFGFTEPLISPLSPTSYANVAQPPLAWAGNLSAWAPQLRFEHRLQLNEANQLGLEVGLWDAVYGGTNLHPYQLLPSAEESQRWPAVESRLSWTMNSRTPFHVALGGFRGALKTKYEATIPSWAFNTDFALRLFPKLSISGELYRGSSLAGLGGGSHKDILIGIDPSTGDERVIGLNSVGGWTQFKLAWPQAVEFNAAIGEDSGYGRDFRRLVLAGNNNPITSLARNQMIMGNIIFRPRTYLILSPEYRRILSGRISGTSYAANVFTLSAGYSF